MVSTIQINESTIGLLKRLKELYKTKTYDALIRRLIHKKVPKSMHGALADKKRYTMQMILKGLRDERERI